jgi:hypothetical protein
MAKADLLVYKQCLDSKGLKESKLSKVVTNKFKIICYLIYKNNPGASTKELCQKCSIILDLLLQNAEFDITVMNFSL